VSLLDGADVIALDLVDAFPTAGALTVRADMTRLPLRSGSLDGALYAASLHYAPIDRVVSEAARVLRADGTLVAVDSPIYGDPQSRADAVARAAAYYTRAGHPDLTGHYHPIEVAALRSALTASGFQVERLEAGHPGGIWMRMTHRPPSSLVVARLLG
jgi:SAM-dependent methyltransferase